MTRIRYRTSGIFQFSNQFMINPDIMVRAVINTASNSFSILDQNNSVIKTGSSSSLQNCKNKIRSELLLLGVNLYSEVKNRRIQ
jgi:hypothetical protein